MNTKERKLWWSTGSGRIELSLTYAQADSCFHSGPCDADVHALSEQPDIKAQLEAIDPALLSKELKEYGAWDDEERADHAQNLQRLLWIATSDIADRPEDYYEEELAR